MQTELNRESRINISMNKLPTLCASILVMLIGMISLLGWIFDIETFKQFLHHGIAIKANTAIALMLAGLSLCLFVSGPTT